MHLRLGDVTMLPATPSKRPNTLAISKSRERAKQKAAMR
jgi:hypothetical protein